MTNEIEMETQIAKYRDMTGDELLLQLQYSERRIAELEKCKAELERRINAPIESEQRYKVLIETSTDMIFTVNMKGDFSFVNKAFETHLGYSEDEIKLINGFDLVHPEDKRYVRENFYQLNKGENIEIEYRYQKKDGSYINISNYASPIFDSDGVVTSAIGIARNITKQKKEENEALRKSEERFRILFEFAPDAYYINDIKGNFIDGNMAAEDLIGYKRDELIGRNFLESGILPFQQVPKAIELLLRNRLGRSTGPDVFTLNRKDGSQVYVEIRTFPIQIQDQHLVLGIARDITEHKKAEEALADSELKFRTLAEHSPNMIFINNRKGQIVYANKRCEEVTGYTLDELFSSDLNFYNLTAPESIELIKTNFAKHLCGKDLPPYEYTIFTKDGNKIEAINNSKLINYGGETAILSVVTDITERKQAEKVLLQSEEKLRLMFESITEGVMVTDLDGIILQVNEATVRLHGYDNKDDLIDRSVFEFIARKDHGKAERNLRKTLIEGHLDRTEYTLLRRDGSEFTAELTAAVLKDIAGSVVGIIAITKDITEIKKAQEQAQRTQLLASLGKMTASIAHEVNNPLGSILLYSELLMADSLPKGTGILAEEIRLLEHNLPVRLDVKRRILKELWSRKTKYPNTPVQYSKTG